MIESTSETSRADEFRKITEQNKMLRDALHILNEAAEGAIDESVILFVGGGKKLNYDDISNIVHKALEDTK